MMAADLDSFLAEMRADLSAFEEHWRREHEANPQRFPMVMPDGNEGAWYEQFIAFTETERSGEETS